MPYLLNASKKMLSPSLKRARSSPAICRTPFRWQASSRGATLPAYSDLAGRRSLVEASFCTQVAQESAEFDWCPDVRDLLLPVSDR